MICRQNGINSNIWFDNATHKIHLSDAIDSILEDEKLWIAFAEKLREPFEKDCYPLQRVSASRTSLDDRERKSELAIVVSLRCIKICLLLLQKLSDKMPGHSIEQVKSHRTPDVFAQRQNARSHHIQITNKSSKTGIFAQR